MPFESPATPAAHPAEVRALVWTRGRDSRSATYSELIRAVVPDVDPAEHLISRLRFYGATVDSARVSPALQSPGRCALSRAAPPPPAAGIVLIVGAFPAVMYEGAASTLAERDIATVYTSGGEGNLRLILNQLAARGWPVDRLVLIGHGPGGPVAQLIGMSSSAVRGIVSLDGFEALDPRRHPGLTGDAGWRPGHLRAPILHFRPTGHPDADSSFHVAAARSETWQVTLTSVTGRQWLTAPEVALAPPALQPLIGESNGALQQRVTAATVAFVTAVLRDATLDSATLRALLPGPFSITHRPPLAPPAIRTDGRLDESIWATARQVADASDVRLRIAEDCDYLYAAVVPPRETPFITEFFVQGATGAQGGERSAGLTAGDLLLHASASLCRAFGAAEVASSDCSRSDAWWGASRTNQASDPAVAEYYIAKRHLQLARCQSASGLRAGALVGGWGPTRLSPAGADKGKPSTWSAIPPR